MKSVQPVKKSLVTLWVGAALLLFLSVFVAASGSDAGPTQGAVHAAAGNPDDLTGNEACKKCHEEEFNRFSGTPHAHMADSRFKSDMKQGCESCHGPGKQHVLAETKRKEAMDMGQEAPEYDASLIVSFRNKSPKDVSDTCLACHADNVEQHGNFRRGEHWRNDVGCVDCHEPHGMPLPPDRLGSQTHVLTATKHKPDWGSQAMLKESEPQLCLKCHNDVRAQFTMPFRHRVLEGSVTCSDCHNAHGGFESRQARLATGNDQVCVKCHTDKQGPFAFEHAPLKTEGCVACHNTHGSSNPRMLKRANVTQLCLECHTDTGGIGAPGTPSFHNLAQEKWRNCTTCHVQIHGSMTHPLYFR